ncbi:MAG: Membrane associated serine protease, rhomboid family [Ramlibacter sp.]|nr:Membrane associated serine protease, rhomboid family [Ramlibacter sp.]
MTPDFEPTQPLDEAASTGRRRRLAPPSNTLLLCLAMLAMTAVVVWHSASWTQGDNAAIIRFGANFPQGSHDRYGQWRLLAAKLQFSSWQVSAILLPFFWVVSRAFERTYGRLVHLGFFIGAALLTSTATLFFLHNEKLMSVGCGGPTLAMTGCLAVASACGRVGVPPLRSVLGWRTLLAVPFLGFSIVALASGSADAASLLGGLAAGAVAGLVLPSATQPAQAHDSAVLGGAALAAIALVTAGLVLAPRPSYYLSESIAFHKLVSGYGPEVDGLNRRFEAMAELGLSEQLSREQLAARSVSDVQPAWRAAAAKWAAVRVNPAVPDAEKLPLMQAYLADKLAFLEATARSWAADDAAALIEASKHKDALERARVALATPSK